MQAALDLGRRMTPAEYLEWEAQQVERHEYWRGEIYTMSGGTRRHSRLSANMTIALGGALRGSRCAPHSSDQRIRIPGGDRYVYADVSVVCGPWRGTDTELENPSLVVEVISPSSEAHDRGAKWDAYREIESLRDYLLVSQDRTQVEHYRRGEDGAWIFTAHGPGSTVCTSIGAQLAVDALYEGVFDEATG
jgi:Uma2 family endonuclease